MDFNEKLTERWLLQNLLKTQHISQEEFNLYSSTPRGFDKQNWHSFSVIESYSLNSHLNDELITTEWMTNWLGELLNLPVENIDPLKVDVAKITNVMSFDFAKQHNILPIASNDEEVVVAGAEPGLQENWLNVINKIIRDKKLTFVLADPKAIEKYRNEFYTLARSIKGAETSHEAFSGISNFEQLIQLGDNVDASDEHIVNIVDWLLQYAYQQRASDIHLEPRREKGRLRFRIDGILHDVYEMPVNISMAVISRLKILGRLDVGEKRRPQDGRIKTLTPNGQEVELRLSTLPTAFGEKLVMRIFDPAVLVRSFEELGLVEEDLVLWNQFTSEPNGIIFVTGPTGSGKTTTLYSTLKKLATSEVNVCSIEDPIEMVDGSFNQTQVQSKIDVGFAEGVKALLRQDPDIIMIGEIRDLETANMAIQAALTGHLVLTTLHTNDAPSSITRLLDLGVPGYLISATTLGVVAQRLVRVLCKHCKQETIIDEAVWNELTTPWKSKVPEKIYKPVGCLECRDTGYKGRRGLYEVMPMTTDMKRTMHNNPSLQDLKKNVYTSGVQPLRLRGVKMMAAGITSLEEVLRVTPMVDFL